MKIYTRAGDDGKTRLLGPDRVSKDSARLEAYGTVDELNATLGVARASGGLGSEADALVEQIQHDLFVLGASLADPSPTGRFQSAIGAEHVAALEAQIDALEAGLPPLTAFILPGGTAAGAQLQLARTVARRAERRVVALGDLPGQHVAPFAIRYLNRLSDLLFVLGRAVNHHDGVADTVWRGL
jgi:cob(I)alamin adenosyltransferase